MVLTTGVGTGHTEPYCSAACLQNVLTGEVICLGHEVRALLTELGMEAPPKVYTVHTSEDGSQNVIQLNNRYYFFNRTERTLSEITFDLSDHCSLSFSPDCRYMVVEKMRAGEEIISDLWLIDLQTMDSRLIVNTAPTAGLSTFSADGRYFYTYLMANGAVEQNEDAEWLLYDTQTDHSFQGVGKILYFANGILISHTSDAFHAYDCQTGNIPNDLSHLPAVAVVTTRASRHTLSLYHPATGELNSAFANLGAYEISPDYRYLYTYIAHDTHIVVTDLYSGDSFQLPLSQRFLQESQPGENQKTTFSISVHPAGGEIQIRYHISESAADEEMREDIKDLRKIIEEEFLNAPNLPAFWERFQVLSAPYAHLLRGVYYDIHDEYVNLQISYIFTPYMHPSSEKQSTTILYFVEDYRSDTFTLFRGVLSNSCKVNGVYGKSAAQTAKQTFRKTLIDGNYEVSCQMLPTVGEERIVYIDFAKCFNASGKYQDSLAEAEYYAYTTLRPAVIGSNLPTFPNDLDRLVEIVSRYPLTKREQIHPTNRFVAEIKLYDPLKNTIYHAHVLVDANGKYYLSNRLISIDNWACRQITEEEYEFIMKLQGGFLYETGMYLDKQISSAPTDHSTEADYDYLICGRLPTYRLNIANVNTALAMLREGTYSHTEIFKTVYSPDQQQYVKLFMKYQPNYRQLLHPPTSAAGYIQIVLNNGVISFTDPFPDAPIPPA